MRTPRGGTPLRERRSSITFVDDNSRQGSDVFDDQRFGGAHLQLTAIQLSPLKAMCPWAARNCHCLLMHRSLPHATITIVRKQRPAAAA
jgi:hypothetical protein